VLFLSIFKYICVFCVHVSSPVCRHTALHNLVDRSADELQMESHGAGTKPSGTKTYKQTVYCVFVDGGMFGSSLRLNVHIFNALYCMFKSTCVNAFRTS